MPFDIGGRFGNVQGMIWLPYLWTPRFKRTRVAYYRRSGSLTRLPALGTAEFLSAYQAAHAAAETPSAKSATRAEPAPGSMAALVAAYRASPEWRKDLAPATRADYDKALRPLETRYGHLRVATMPRQFVFKLRDDYATKPAVTKHAPPRPILGPDGVQMTVETPRRANRMVNVLRLLLAWADNRGGWLAAGARNVAERPGRLETGPGFERWTPEQVEAFMAHPDVPEPLKRAAMLGLCTGMRKQDCLALARTARRDGAIEVTPQKTSRSTGTKLWIPEHPDLTRALDAAPPSITPTLLTRGDGSPWKEDNFNHRFADAVKVAGLTGLSFHGLRKTASSWLAEGGCTDAEIDAILGHSDPKMTRLYRKQADQRVNATAAMTKMSARRIGRTKEIG